MANNHITTFQNGTIEIKISNLEQNRTKFDTASVSRKKICLQNNLRSSETFQIRVQKDFNPVVSAIAWDFAAGINVYAKEF